MEEITEQDFKFENNEDFWEKCKDPQQKDAILKFLHTDDSYYCGLKIGAESIDQVEDRDIKLQLILRLSRNDFVKVVDKLINEHNKKLIKKESDKKDDENKKENENDNDIEKIDSESPTLTYDDLLGYFLNKDFNEFSSPIEVSCFISKCLFLSNVCHLMLLNHLENQFKKLLKGENIDLHNYFYVNRENRIRLMRPKQEFFDLCLEKELNTWADYAFAYLPRSKQTKENFSKIPSEFRVSVLALSNHISWKLIDCLSTKQKQELVDQKVITEEDFLNKKVAKICLTVPSICSAILLAGLIACCIFAPFFGPIWASICIALCAFSTAFGIGEIIYNAYDLYKINKFNEEVRIGQSKTAVPSNDTNNPTVEVENENAQRNDSLYQADEQPPTGIGNQNPNNDEPSSL